MVQMRETSRERKELVGLLSNALIVVKLDICGMTVYKGRRIQADQLIHIGYS